MRCLARPSLPATCASGTRSVSTCRSAGHRPACAASPGQARLQRAPVAHAPFQRTGVRVTGPHALPRPAKPVCNVRQWHTLRFRFNEIKRTPMFPARPSIEFSNFRAQERIPQASWDKSVRSGTRRGFPVHEASKQSASTASISITA
jgi:hypothetical protein